MSALENLRAVLCDPEGRCCIAGSDEDRAIVDRGLADVAELIEAASHLASGPSGAHGVALQRLRAAFARCGG